MKSLAKKDWVLPLPGAFECMEAYFADVAYEPHRHDTYAIGLTLEGVQSFSYRGSQRHSLPGQAVIIHPDETHDGRAGTDVGFRYRVIYLQPALIQSILGGKALPFLQTGVSSDPSLITSLKRLLASNPEAPADFKFEDTLFDLVQALNRAGGAARSNRLQLNYRAAKRAQEYLDAHLDAHVDLAILEDVCGYNRWKLSRDFRVLFGTSPYRYLTMRRLDQVCRNLRAGSSLADAAYACRFADQSHMNRHFKKTFGLTPKAWLSVQNRVRTD